MPWSTTAEYSLTHISTMCTQGSYSWAHVHTGWTVADPWKRWGRARAAFAHPTHHSMQSVWEISVVHCTHCILEKVIYWPLPPSHLNLPSCNCYCVFCLHKQFPYLGFWGPSLVYMTRLGHSSDLNREWVILPSTKVRLTACFSMYMCMWFCRYFNGWVFPLL